MRYVCKTEQFTSAWPKHSMQHSIRACVTQTGANGAMLAVNVYLCKRMMIVETSNNRDSRQVVRTCDFDMCERMLEGERQGQYTHQTADKVPAARDL